jgi:hypothetical protein
MFPIRSLKGKVIVGLVAAAIPLLANAAALLPSAGSTPGLEGFGMDSVFGLFDVLGCWF